MTSNRFHSNLRRGLATVVAVSLGMTAIAANAGAAGPTHTEEITFNSYVHVRPQHDGVSRWTLVADRCTLSADGGAATPCQFTASGTLTATGGKARGRITSRGRMIKLDETFELTGPNTAIGWGPAKVIGARGARSAGSFTGSFEFHPTDKPDVLLDYGTITVTH